MGGSSEGKWNIKSWVKGSINQFNLLDPEWYDFKGKIPGHGAAVWLDQISFTRTSCQKKKKVCIHTLTYSYSSWLNDRRIQAHGLVNEKVSFYWQKNFESYIQRMKNKHYEALCMRFQIFLHHNKFSFESISMSFLKYSHISLSIYIIKYI